jgi:hypothetical protein
MSKRKYPRQAWVLLPSFKPKELTIVEHCRNWGAGMDWDYADGGKAYNVDKLFDTKSDAITAGRAQIAKLQADIAKRQDTLNKRIAALDKAEKESE